MAAPFILALSQRMTVDFSTGELRDALAHDWFQFLGKVLPEVIVVPVPNVGVGVEKWTEALGIDGLLLTGGDDWGVFPQRDETERCLFSWAWETKRPVLGICRGMQVVNYMSGGKFPERKSEEHVAKRHEIEFLRGVPQALEVNSYHHGLLMPQDIAPILRVDAKSQDGAVEALRSDDGMIRGIMWHPERESEPAFCDLKLFKKMFGGTV